MPVNIGCGNMVRSSKVVSILAPESAPLRCPKDDAKERNMLVDATQGPSSLLTATTRSFQRSRWKNLRSGFSEVMRHETA